MSRRRDEELGRAFNDYRRSTALMQLTNIRSLGLLTDEEVRLFSEETQRIVASFNARE
ncbi:MAG: hypothetical protein NTV79_01605 [Candidatus Aureabacteria bacterium]|nr:hypothetical protein [Candidatus Auribacterota bacterium]